MEGGFAAKLKARADTEYEIEVENNADVKYLYNDGIELQAKLLWTGYYQGIGGYYNPELPFIDTEGTNLNLHPINQTVTGGAVRFVENTSGINQDVQLIYKWDIYLSIDGSIAHDSYFWIQLREVEISTNTLIGTTYILNSVYSHAPGTTHHYVGSNILNFTLDDDRRLEVTYRVWEYTAAAFLTANIDYTLTQNSASLELYLINRYEATYHPMLKASKVFEELVTKINDDAYSIPTTYSDLIDTTLNGEIYISCGDAIRGLSGSTMKITYNQFYNLFKYNFNAATYYDVDLGRMYINDLTYVFKNSAHSSIPSLGEVKSCKVLPFSSEMFVNLKIGGGEFTYDTQKGTDIEITNGKDELNLNYNLLSPITKIQKY